MREKAVTSWLTTGLAVTVAFALVAFGLIASNAARPASGVAPHLVSMADSAQAMQQAGAAMQLHGQAMIEKGRRTGSQDQITVGQYWVQSGQALAQGGRWMAMNPLSPGNLLTPPDALADQGSWGELARASGAMLHDPSKARAVDLEALRWNGEAMQAEGRNMAEHGRLMKDEVELMVARHGLGDQTATDLRQAIQTMLGVGGHLQQNGQAMIDYATQLRRSMGYR